MGLDLEKSVNDIESIKIQLKKSFQCIVRVQLQYCWILLLYDEYMLAIASG